jgi:hypothetical protein
MWRHKAGALARRNVRVILGSMIQGLPWLVMNMIGSRESKHERVRRKGARTSVASFVLRFVQGNMENPSDSASANWYGLIKHVQTDTEESFTCMVDALYFMARYINLTDLDEIISTAESGATAADKVSLSD